MRLRQFAVPVRAVMFWLKNGVRSVCRCSLGGAGQQIHEVTGCSRISAGDPRPDPPPGRAGQPGGTGASCGLLTGLDVAVLITPSRASTSAPHLVFVSRVRVRLRSRACRLGNEHAADSWTGRESLSACFLGWEDTRAHPGHPSDFRTRPRFGRRTRVARQTGPVSISTLISGNRDPGVGWPRRGASTTGRAGNAIGC